MPVASSSRRTRRQPSEDIIEELVTQRNKVEDVEMDSGEDTARRRGSRKEKRSKGKKRAAADRDEAVIDADLDGGEIPNEPFDREAFLNQPLSQKQLGKLLLLASDTEVPLRGYKPETMEMTKRLAGHMAEFLTKNQDKV